MSPFARHAADIDRPRVWHHRNQRGSAAIEFALVAPVLFAVLVGVFDVTLALILQQQVYTTAHVIVASASNLAVQPDNTTSLTVAQVQQTLSGIYAVMPTLRNGRQSGVRSAVLTSINFQPTDPSCITSASVPCVYVPYAVWSVSYRDPPGRFAGNATIFQFLTRCPAGHTPLRQVTPVQYAAGDMASLPTQNVTNPLPMLVADVHYQYTPLFFGSFLTGPLDFWASSLWPVRGVNPQRPSTNQYTQYDLTNEAGGAGQCP